MVMPYDELHRSSMHGEPARDADRLAGHVGGVIGEQESDEPRIILRHAEPPHRNGALEPFGDARALGPFEEAAQNGGVGRAGANRIEGEALADKLARERLGQGDDAALASGIDRFARGADTSRIGGDIDDASETARRHAAQHDVADVERPEQIDSDDLAPEIGRGVEEILRAIPAGIVDEKRYRPEGGLETLDRARDRVVIGNVDGVKSRATTTRLDLAGDLLSRRR